MNDSSYFLAQNRLEYHSWFEFAANFVQGFNNETEELYKPHLRESLVDKYVIILFLYGLLSVSGIVLNFFEIFFIVRRKIYQDATYAYLVNLAVADLVKCVFVIPLSQMSLLIQNWIFGRFLCYFLPMLQDIPAHVTILTLLMVVFERYMFVKESVMNRFPGFIFGIISWLIAICITLPYPIYTTYLDLGEGGNLDAAEGVGVCLFSVEKDLKEYARGVFICMFILPLSVIMIIFMKIFKTLDQPDEMENDAKEIPSELLNDPGEDDENLNNLYQLKQFSNSDNQRGKEKLVQKHLVILVLIYIFCFGPLNILSKIIHLETYETYEESRYWDNIFTIFVWIAFVPVILDPIILFSLNWRHIVAENSDITDDVNVQTRILFVRTISSTNEDISAETDFNERQ